MSTSRTVPTVRKPFSTLIMFATLMAGCAGTPPNAQYKVAQSQVDSAVSAGATKFAPVEMKAAHDKLREAAAALHNKDYDTAKRLSQQAEWDARVADRKAHAAKAVKALKDAHEGVSDVREEAWRSAW